VDYLSHVIYISECFSKQQGKLEFLKKKRLFIQKQIAYDYYDYSRFVTGKPD
jgi:hypothetical protein